MPPARKDTWLSVSFCRALLPIAVGSIFNKGHIGGLDKVFELRDFHHWIYHRILRLNEGITFILSQSSKLSFLEPSRPLKALKGPLIKFSHILMHRPNQDLQNVKLSCL